MLSAIQPVYNTKNLNYILFNNLYTDSFHTECCVNNGTLYNPVPPTCFALYTNDLMDELYAGINDIMYPDHMCLRLC